MRNLFVLIYFYLNFFRNHHLQCSLYIYFVVVNVIIIVSIHYKQFFFDKQF